jgi:hypothetical protein
MAKAVVIQLPKSCTLYFSSNSPLSLVWPIPQIIYLGVTVPERSEPKRNYIDVCTVCACSTTLGIILLGEYVGHCTFLLCTFIPTTDT